MAHIPYGGDLIGSSPAFTTEDLELHEKHVQSAESIVRFSNALVHQLNNLLTVTIGYVERAQKMSKDTPQGRSLEHARMGADGMSNALLQLQCFANTVETEGATTCLISAMNDAVEITRIQNPGMNINITVDSPQRIDANAVETSRMFMNLLDNAVQAMDEVQEINIRVREITTQFHPLGLSNGDYVVITVSDTGHGIPEEDLPKIFEPFFTTRFQPGMGLSWVWGFVKKMNGRIRVRSEVGKGTSFEIFLPFGVKSPRRTQAVIRPIRPNLNRRVLIVEDNLDILDILHNVMSNMNYQITTAITSSEAEHLVESQIFDLVIADLMIPGEHSGSDVADLVLERNPLAKVLLITGRLDRQNIIVNSDYLLLAKPFSMEKLTRTIKNILP